MISWSASYILIALLSQSAKAEADELPRLWARLSGVGPISDVQQDRLFQVIADLRRYNRGMTLSSLVLMGVLRQRGVSLAPQAKQALLSEARAKYGACVGELSPDRLNFNSQLSYVNGALGKD